MKKPNMMGFEENGQMSYGLRENPKKSWKFSSSNNVNVGSDCSNPMQENQCKVCGKDFESQKALFGHMRHHSGTRIPCKDCGKTFLSLKSLANHSRLHPAESRHDLGVKKKSLCVKKKRSSRKRYNFSTSCSVSSLNESLSVSVIDQQVEQAARCLMMLSRGVCNIEFPDDVSVTFEIESLNGSEFFTMEKPGESLIAVYEKRENTCVQHACSGIESIEKKKIGLEVSIERFYKGGEFGNLVEEELSKDLMKEVGSGIKGPISSKKDVSFAACHAEFGGDFSNNVVDVTTSNGEIKCKTCNRMFGSRRALAGHQRMHGTKTPKPGNCARQKKNASMSPETEAGCKLVRLECLVNSMEQEMGGGAVSGHTRLSKSKKHKCPICFRDFATIQALGGHKRVHLVKKSRRGRKMVIKKEHFEICDELDPDLPIMPGEEDKGDARSEPQAYTANGESSGGC